MQWALGLRWASGSAVTVAVAVAVGLGLEFLWGFWMACELGFGLDCPMGSWWGFALECEPVSWSRSKLRWPSQ